ncbi:MAG TPA: YkgJ family cysteine cluster protein [Crocinitomix sp.]|nr:YkgJ family cysteine cluster protein [Crocinitomix sp.]
MKKNLETLIKDRKENKIGTARVFKKLKRFKKNKLDDLFHQQHLETFNKIDCLECANCCKTTSPIFRDRDIERLSKHLKIKTVEFIDLYLKIDTDNDYVLKRAPCPFLWLDDNKCSVYEYRPLACREYPHTNRKNMYQILELTKKNLEICPAVCDIINNVETRV